MRFRHIAFQWAAGILPGDALVSKEAQTPEAKAAVEALLVAPPQEEKQSAPDEK
jgi:hypothetical protein